MTLPSFGPWFSNAMPTNGQIKFLRRIKSLSQEERFCDVHITFSDGNRKFNSLVMASLSPFFEAMLSSSMKEGLTGEVSLPTVSVEVFDAVMSYYMDGEGELDEKALYEAVDACEMMELPDLKDVCILNMKENLSVGNCVRIWQLSKKYTEDQTLVQSSFKLIIENIGIVSTQEYFLGLSKSEILEIITSERSTLMHECLFFEAVLKWTEANEPEEACIKEMIREIRFQLLQESDLLKMIVQYHEILYKYKSLEKAIEIYVLNGATSRSLEEDDTFTSSLHKVIVVCSSSDKPILHVHAWHLSHKKWYDLSTDIPEARTQFAASAAGSKIVVTGGKTNDEVLSETLIYDSFANKWEKGPDLNTARWRHGSVEVNGKMYVFGGENESFLDTIEMLDIENGKWDVVGNLATAVANPILTTSGQYVIVMGGYKKSSQKEEDLSSVIQCFTIENKSTTILRGSFGYLRNGSSESSVIYITKIEQYHDKLCCLVVEEKNEEIKLWEQRTEIPLPWGFNPEKDTQFVVCDDVGFVFSKSYTRQINLYAAERCEVVLPTIPGPVSHVWSGFKMFVADRCLRRVAPS